MIVTTTPQIEGHPIQQYFGVVSGEVIIGANVLKDLMASLHDFFGGRSTEYENTLIEARENAMREMMGRANQMGANAIVGVDVDYETVGSNGSMLMVSVTGTAVRI